MSEPRADIRLVPVGENDVPQLLDLILELADYEKLTHLVTADVDTLSKWLFGKRRVVEALLLYLGDQLAGHCLFFYNFSTFTGRPGIYIEDLYVRPAFRRSGIGRAVFRDLGRRMREEGLGRLEFAVLDWNESAMRFYRSLGAEEMPEWRMFRVSGEALDKLGDI